jgi:orotate phosphoribosyltransferase
VTPQAEPVLTLFRSTGAYLQGHFRLTSGLHSDSYLQCALVLQHPEHAARLGRLLAGELQKSAAVRVGVVVSPALGGVIIGHEVARALDTRFLFTERDPGTKEMALRRGFTVTPGEVAVVVEDVITTGGSTADVVRALTAAGASVAAAGSIIDRSGGTADVGVPRVALATLRVPAWDAAECPLCREGIPLVKPGSRPV